MRNLILLSAAAALTATSFAASVSPAEARRHVAKQQREWRGADGRMHCRRSNGTVGLVVGGGAGALIGHRIARRRSCR